MYKTHVARIQVRSYEVDVEGRVNNAVFVNYLEHSRTRAMEDFGISFQAWLERGLSIVVTRIDMSIHAPAFIGDELEVHLTPLEIGLVKAKVRQVIMNLTRGSKAVTATVYGAFVDNRGKPVRIPEEFKKAFLTLKT